MVELAIHCSPYNLVGKMEIHDNYHDGGLYIAQWSKVSSSVFDICEGQEGITLAKQWHENLWCVWKTESSSDLAKHKCRKGEVEHKLG